MEDLLFAGFLFALCFYVVRAWLRWFRSEPKLVAPVWRSSITLFGFAASTISLASIIFLMIYASVSSSFTPYHPTAVLADRIIFLTSLTAIVAGIIGTGPLETPTFACSVLCLLILFIALFAS
jgi:hypothetical protein